MEETVREPEVIENEINTGIVITGAYADKLRRTLFAQLSKYIRKSKEHAREAARASGELNKLLYIIIVENLKSDKGDAVRIRIKYRFDPRVNRIDWDYDTLRIEFFKRQSDEEVNNIVKKTLETRLDEIKREFTPIPREEAKAESSRETIVERVESINLYELIGSVVPIGETSIGGVVFKLSDRRGEELGIVSVEPGGDTLIIDAIVIYGGRAYRAYGRSNKDKNVYLSNPNELLKDLSNIKPLPITSEVAEKMISQKMGELT
uniref:DUF2258 domain-containing protein n=1 Tax=Staphylothermus marinus TaxID=2280 RepID=A0A7C4HE11_STAMA